MTPELEPRNGLQPYKCLEGVESYGGYGSLAVKIFVSTREAVDLTNDKLRDAAWKAREMVEEELKALLIQSNPEALARAGTERQQIIGLFGGRSIFVEEIGNGYCKRACCRHLPWFVITTNIGRFNIGWRKSVMHVEWTETTVKKDADELFPDEPVTKSERTIHAWGWDKAREYVQKILAEGGAS